MTIARDCQQTVRDEARKTRELTQYLLIWLVRRHGLDVADREVFDQVAVRVESEGAGRRRVRLDDTWEGTKVSAGSELQKLGGLKTHHAVQ